MNTAVVLLCCILWIGYVGMVIGSECHRRRVKRENEIRLVAWWQDMKSAQVEGRIPPPPPNRIEYR